MIEILYLAVGLVLLWKSGDFLVEGASAIAKKRGVSDLVIGLTLIAFGTSAPELVVNTIASWQNKPDIILGNVLGSNIANTLLILGIAGLIYPISVKIQSVRKEIPFSIIALVIFAALALMPIMGPSLLVSRFDSVVLLILFMAFLGYLFISAKDSIPEETTTLSMKKAYGLFLIGLIGLPIAGQLVITGAIHMASQFHISEALISLFAVALGTSLPELATAVVAVKKRKPDLVIGNIIGSNIFNILLVVGISSGIRSIQVNPIFMFEFGVLFIASICLMVTMITLKRHKFDRIEASLFLLSYAVYIGYIFVRG